MLPVSVLLPQLGYLEEGEKGTKNIKVLRLVFIMNLVEPFNSGCTTYYIQERATIYCFLTKRRR